MRSITFRTTRNPLFLSEQHLAANVHNGTDGTYDHELAEDLEDDLRERWLLLNLWNLSNGGKPLRIKLLRRIIVGHLILAHHRHWETPMKASIP
jgi:hypothetical protein